MSESRSGTTAVIPEGVAAERFAQGMSLLDVFTQIWLANPALAKQAGRRVEEFILPIEEVQARHANDLR